MSLMQLLTTGKALEGQHNSSHRYQMTSQKLVPKFGSKRNPFAARKSDAAAPDAAATQAAIAPVPAKAPAPSVFSNGPAPQPWSARLASWVSGLKAKLSRPQRGLQRAQPTTAAAALPGAVVQGELLLDGIKVVRNDLSETDLEIVTIKPEGADAGTVKSNGAITPRKRGTPERAWDRLRSRLTGAGRN